MMIFHNRSAQATAFCTAIPTATKNSPIVLAQEPRNYAQPSDSQPASQAMADEPSTYPKPDSQAPPATIPEPSPITTSSQSFSVVRQPTQTPNIYTTDVIQLSEPPPEPIQGPEITLDSDVSGDKMAYGSAVASSLAQIPQEPSRLAVWTVTSSVASVASVATLIIQESLNPPASTSGATAAGLAPPLSTSAPKPSTEPYSAAPASSPVLNGLEKGETVAPVGVAYAAIQPSPSAASMYQLVSENRLQDVPVSHTAEVDSSASHLVSQISIYVKQILQSTSLAQLGGKRPIYTSSRILTPPSLAAKTIPVTQPGGFGSAGQVPEGSSSDIPTIQTSTEPSPPAAGTPKSSFNAISGLLGVAKAAEQPSTSPARLSTSAVTSKILPTTQVGDTGRQSQGPSSLTSNSPASHISVAVSSSPALTAGDAGVGGVTRVLKQGIDTLETSLRSPEGNTQVASSSLEIAPPPSSIMSEPLGSTSTNPPSLSPNQPPSPSKTKQAILTDAGVNKEVSES
jgi:hypothetical protein